MRETDAPEWFPLTVTAAEPDGLERLPLPVMVPDASVNVSEA